MPVIDRIALHFVNGPLPAPFSPAWVPGPPRRSTLFYLAQFVTDDGIEGWSAFSAGGRERAGIGDAVANLFLGADPTDIGRVRECIHIMGVLGVRNGWLEPAFWDIKGKLAGKPVYELLGGKAVPVTLYASSGEVKDPAARIDEAWARCASEAATARSERAGAGCCDTDISGSPFVVGRPCCRPDDPTVLGGATRAPGCAVPSPPGGNVP